MNIRRQMIKIISIVLSLCVAISTIPARVNIIVSAATIAGHVLQEPQINSMGETIWDCIWFGNYYQYAENDEIKEPIKWRILSIDGNKALLLADKNLDYKPFNEITPELDEVENNEEELQEYEQDILSIKWKNSTIRSWLNGYDNEENSLELDYTSDNFIDSAFSEKEQEAILTSRVHQEIDYTNLIGISTDDKIYLLSKSDYLSEKYGFERTEKTEDIQLETSMIEQEYSKNRVSFATEYEMGKHIVPIDLWEEGNYVEESLTRDCSEQKASFVNIDGEFEESEIENPKGIRPCIYLDLSDTSLFSYAGTVGETKREDKSYYTSTKGQSEKSFSSLINSINTSTFQEYIDTIDTRLDIKIPGLKKTNQSTRTKKETCKTMVPQGVCVTDKYLLISAYDGNGSVKNQKYKHKKKHNSVIYVLNRNTRSYVTTLTLNNKSHVGAIEWNKKTGNGGVIYIADSSKKPYKVWKLNTNEIDEKVRANVDKSQVTLTKYFDVGNLLPSFLTFYGNRLFVGQFSKAKDNSFMKVFNDGSYGKANKALKISVPVQTQGVAFTTGNDGNEYLITSSSFGRKKNSELNVFRISVRDTIISKSSKPINQISIPCMSEDISIFGNDLYVVYESASSKYYYGLDGNGKSICPVDRVIVSDVGEIVQIAHSNTRSLDVPLYETVIEEKSKKLAVITKGYCGNNATYTLFSDGTLSISGAGSMDDYKYSRTPWKEYNSSIKYIVIGGNITSIGENAFYGLTSLTSVDFSGFLCNEKNFTIGEYAFANCPNLHKVNIPEIKGNISDTAFNNEIDMFILVDNYNYENASFIKKSSSRTTKLYEYKNLTAIKKRKYKLKVVVKDGK